MNQQPKSVNEAIERADVTDGRELTTAEVELVSGGLRPTGCTFQRTGMFPGHTDVDGDIGSC